MGPCFNTLSFKNLTKKKKQEQERWGSLLLTFSHNLQGVLISLHLPQVNCKEFKHVLGGVKHLISNCFWAKNIPCSDIQTYSHAKALYHVSPLIGCLVSPAHVIVHQTQQWKEWEAADVCFSMRKTFQGCFFFFNPQTQQSSGSIKAILQWKRGVPFPIASNLSVLTFRMRD